MQKLFLVATSFLIIVSGFAQNKKERRDENRKRINALIKQEEEGVIAYERSTAFGAKLINDGYGIFFEIGRAQAYLIYFGIKCLKILLFKLNGCIKLTFCKRRGFISE